MILAACRRWRWRLAGAITVAVFVALVARFWHPVYGFTVFYQLDASNDAYKIAAFRDLPVYVHRDAGGYDGLFYAQIAHDPTLRDPGLARAMDDFPYRARRILAPALAWLFGLGQSKWIIHTYALLNVAAWLALAAIGWRLFDVNDARGWFAWAGVLFSAGALNSVRLALTDLLALLLVAAAMFATERARGRLSVALFASAALARETALVAVAALCKPPWLSPKNLVRVLLTVAPLAAWLAYVRWRVGGGDTGWENFTLPGAGLAGKWREALAATGTVADQPLAWAALLATLAVTVQAAYFMVRPQPSDRWWRIGASFTALAFFLGTAVWEGFPGAAARVLLPLQLSFNVLVHRTRAPLVWLVTGNLSIFAGLLALRDVPANPGRLVEQRLGETVAVVRFEPDWHGREEDWRHVWLWTEERGTFTIETTRPLARRVRVEFGLRSLVPRTVVLQFEGREIWRSEIDSELSRHAVRLPAIARHAKLEFTTETPPVPESDDPDSRELAFALYDLRLALAEP
jgi:hypothetical protein